MMKTKLVHALLFVCLLGDPTTDTGDPIATDTVTGRRVKARG